MKTEHTKPKGELAICTLAMPSDTNPNGDIFGGWVVSTMDLAGLVIIKHHTPNRIVTVAINSVEFIAPVRVGDTVSCFGEVIKIGNTSITLQIEAWIQGYAKGANRNKMVSKGTFVYVAIDDNGKPIPIQKTEK